MREDDVHVLYRSPIHVVADGASAVGFSICARETALGNVRVFYCQLPPGPGLLSLPPLSFLPLFRPFLATLSRMTRKTRKLEVDGPIGDDSNTHS